jgi:hypothetical protein
LEQLIAETDVFCRFVCRPVTRPNFSRRSFKFEPGRTAV